MSTLDEFFHMNWFALLCNHSSGLPKQLMSVVDQTTTMSAANNNVTIQILGITDTPVVLGGSQLHGNRMLLLNNTESVQLLIRPTKRTCTSVPFFPQMKRARVHGIESTARTRRRHRHRGVCTRDAICPWTRGTRATSVGSCETTGTTCERPGGSQPTVFQDRVYNHIQHGLISLLLWSLGGMSNTLQYTPGLHHRTSKKKKILCGGACSRVPTVYPRGPANFPHFLIQDAQSVGLRLQCDIVGRDQLLRADS